MAATQVGRCCKLPAAHSTDSNLMEDKRDRQTDRHKKLSTVIVLNSCERVSVKGVGGWRQIECFVL